VVDKTFLANAENGGSGRPFAGELPTQNENQKCTFQNLFFRDVFLKRVGNSPAKKVVEKTFLANRPDEHICRHRIRFLRSASGGQNLRENYLRGFRLPIGRAKSSRKIIATFLPSQKINLIF